jgi:hypothetical protein
MEFSCHRQRPQVALSVHAAELLGGGKLTPNYIMCKQFAIM